MIRRRDNPSFGSRTVNTTTKSLIVAGLGQGNSMKTRGRRFFVVLIHLLGVSHDHHHHPLPNSNNPLLQLDVEGEQQPLQSTTTPTAATMNAVAAARSWSVALERIDLYSATTGTLTTPATTCTSATAPEECAAPSPPSSSFSSSSTSSTTASLLTRQHTHPSPFTNHKTADELAKATAHMPDTSSTLQQQSSTNTRNQPTQTPETMDRNNNKDHYHHAGSESPTRIALHPERSRSTPRRVSQEAPHQPADGLSPSSSSPLDLPLWIQDTIDGSCLGPMGTFSECGDATVWMVQRHPLRMTHPASSTTTTSRMRQNIFATKPSIHDSVRQWLASAFVFSNGLFSTPSQSRSSTSSNNNYGLTFRFVDWDFESVTTTSATDIRPQKQSDGAVPVEASECLNIAHNRSLSWQVSVSKCQQRRRWRTGPVTVWILDFNGRLRPTQESLDLHPTQRHQNQQRFCRSWQNKDLTSQTLCLSRGNGNQVHLIDCNSPGDWRPVQFAFYSYRPVAQSLASGRTPTYKTDGDSTSRRGSTNIPKATDAQSDTQDVNPSLHPDLKLKSSLIFDFNKPKANAVHSHTKRPRFGGVLSDINPILLAGYKDEKVLPTKAAKLHHTATLPIEASEDDMKALKISRMQTHPYLNDAKDGLWTDPQTGLQFFTDLCKYLGRHCNEYGRHTLTGMGIYRKGYVIKVYAIAYYVSKRDVRTDPSLERFASLSADQLRLRPDFYAILRKMGNPDSGRESLFDRTIMLKTNMQLSAETMRSSLQADWSYLTEEAKSKLVGVSMNTRPADDNMLTLIQSPDNPSRCSCSQTAPPEYEANPECCARGTELVFTWTKANDLEVLMRDLNLNASKSFLTDKLLSNQQVRLNGRLMETFPRRDIAEGIFYEYLRYDNPISTELLDRVVDGFPFLLGSRAHARGMNSGHSSSSKRASSRNSAMLDTMAAFTESFVSELTDAAESAKYSAIETMEHAGDAAKAFVSTMKEFAVEADRRRDLMVKHTVEAPGTLMKLLSRDEETIRSLSNWISGEVDVPEIAQEEESQAPSMRRDRIFGYPLSRWFGEDYFAPDEIGPMKVTPAINRVFLTLVHLYLLLLFIVSFPGSYATRMKTIIRKSPFSSHEMSDDSDSDISEENGKTYTEGSFSGEQPSHFYIPRSLSRQRPNDKSTELRTNASTATDSGLRKKSLSYFL